MIHQRLQAVWKRIQNACQRSKRDPKEIELVLVTKEVSLEDIRAAYETGSRNFGENRVQEFRAKRESLPEDIRWHFVGYLQTNKVKFVVGDAALVHSCDRLELAQTLQNQAEKKNRTLQILIQVNTSGEPTKHGFHPEDLEHAVSEIIRYDRLVVCGLMTIGPLTDEEARIRKSFRLLRTFRENLQNKFPSAEWRYLSMGMSSDFEIAIEEGANCLRIGTAVFGPRPVRT